VFLCHEITHPGPDLPVLSGERRSGGGERRRLGDNPPLMLRILKWIALGVGDYYTEDLFVEVVRTGRVKSRQLDR
jgi:hypothetical protein